MDIFAKLSAPFKDDEIEWRLGSTTKDKKKGVMLAYVTNRAIMNRLDEVVGPENWKQTFREIHKGIVCALSIRTTENGDWITKEDGADLTNVEATKGGLSDAMKRAAVQFGVGRYLYEADSVWVELNEFGYPKTKPTKVTFGGKATQPKELSPRDACEKLLGCATLDELKDTFTALPKSLQSDVEVIAMKDELKNKLS